MLAERIKGEMSANTPFPPLLSANFQILYASNEKAVLLRDNFTIILDS